jgi:hypothetical protein
VESQRPAACMHSDRSMAGIDTTDPGAPKNKMAACGCFFFFAKMSVGGKGVLHNPKPVLGKRAVAMCVSFTLLLFFK